MVASGAKLTQLVLATIGSKSAQFAANYRGNSRQGRSPAPFYPHRAPRWQFLPTGVAFGLSVMTRDPRFRRLSDGVADTMVIFEARSRAEFVFRRVTLGTGAWISSLVA
jgi:hypothetical protein